jgi:hypothetical protein
MTLLFDEVMVSIVTPTFPGRENELFRCINSVEALDWPNVEHIILSDRNSWLQENYGGAWTGDWYDHSAGRRRIRFAEINETWRNPTTEASIGAIPWYVGSLMALGEFVGFLGDDDELLPDHAARHIEAMRQNDAMFSISQIEFRAGGEHQFIIGNDSFQHGHLDATGIMCHVSALSVCTWIANGENAADWRLVRDWLAAGLKGVYVGDGPTGVHNDGWVTGKTGRPDRPQ